MDFSEGFYDDEDDSEEDEDDSFSNKKEDENDENLKVSGDEGGGGGEEEEEEEEEGGGRKSDSGRNVSMPKKKSLMNSQPQGRRVISRGGRAKEKLNLDELDMLSRSLGEVCCICL